MKYAYFKNGRVETAVNDETIDDSPKGAHELNDDQFEKRFDLKLVNGGLINDPIATPQPSQQVLMQQAVSAVKFALQSAIDSKAREFGFSNGNAYMLYAGFTNAFKATALVFAQWEASVWVEAEAYKVKVLAGAAPMLSPDEAVAMMPAYPASII